ncbi:MAG: helix-turn-helix domain-containing protein [Prevotellaceae bacterium]|jgi:transcriptional regulator with XRE-family HTH domain|nr:helix-turn-helix domain-containing protein [Prevotellaceae bacterium]
MKNIHIGKLIKEKFDEKKMTKAEFARKVHIHRSTVYLLFEQKSIDVELLLAISKVLDYNFIEEVYLKRLPPEKENTVIVGVEIDRSQLQSLDLPKEFLTLSKFITQNV